MRALSAGAKLKLWGYPVMRDVDFGTGMVKALVAAGPAFVTALWAATSFGRNDPVAIAPWMATAPAVLAITIIPGAVLAMLPVVIGTHVLAWLGRGNAGLRHSAIWGLVGGGTVAALLARAGSPGEAGIALIATGTLCALLARSGVHWEQPSPRP